MCSALALQVFRDLFSVGTSEIFGSGLMRMLARWLRVIGPARNAHHRHHLLAELLQDLLLVLLDLRLGVFDVALETLLLRSIFL